MASLVSEWECLVVTCPKGVSAVHISRPLPKAGDKKIGQSHVSAQYVVSVQIPQSFFFYSLFNVDIHYKSLQ